MLEYGHMRKIIATICLATMANAYADRAHKQIKSPVPIVSAAFSTESILVADFDGNVIHEQDQYLVRPIASISKLLLALLVTEQDLTELLQIPKIRQVMSVIPHNISSLSRHELLTLALVKSDNFAAQILCSNIERCVDRMNEHAKTIGMLNTHYNEPTGLDKGNVSTANDLLKLVIVSAGNSIITSISSMPTAQLGNRISIRNTNPLTSKINVILSKTGFTNPAGGCLVMAVNSPVGQRILILLGSRNTKTRISVMEKLYREMK